MPRNGGGIYALPEPDFSPGTTISSAAVNSDLGDLGDAITDSLARDGQGGMTGVLPLIDDGFSYSADPNTGIHRTAADTQAIQCGGTDVATFSPTAQNFTAPQRGGTALDFIPIGTAALWLTNAAPSRWLLCDGSAVSRTTYATLFTLFGGNFGAGDGSTTFNLPNLTGRAPVGRDAAGSVLSGASVLGTALGAQTVTLDTTMIPSHGHSFAGTAASHSHTDSESPGSIEVQSGGGQLVARSPIPSNTGLTSVTPAGTIGNTGGGAAHSNVQPSLVVNFIVYAGV